jgi:hypothetical protein
MKILRASDVCSLVCPRFARFGVTEIQKRDPWPHFLEYALESWREYINRRWNGTWPSCPERPSDSDGTYSDKKRDDGKWDSFYHPGPNDLALMESEDRKYLKDLATANPLLFLQEMTPIENHDGRQLGLDLREPLHRTYQEEFRDDVARVFKEYISEWIQKLSGLDVVLHTKVEEEALAKLRQEVDMLKEERDAKDAEYKVERLAAITQNEQLKADLAAANLQIQTLQARLTLATRVAVPTLLRIWGGKYASKDVRPAYRVVGKKTGGTAVGFIAAEVHPTAVKRYMAKSGIPKDQNKVSVTLSSRRELHYRSYLGIIKEVIAAHLYTLLGSKAFYVPKHRLSLMEVINEQTQDNALAIALMEEVNRGRAAEDRIVQSLHLLSRWIERYRDLAELEPCYVDSDPEPRSFQAWVEAGRAPDYASIDGHRVPILGLMEVLAASRLLGDTDVLGGGSTNAGFVVESQEGTPVAVRVVKIDAGEAFNFHGEHNQFTHCANKRYRGPKLQDPKDLQFGNQQPKVILWGKLLDEQKRRFLNTLTRGYEALKDADLIDFMIHRRGAFDEAIPGGRTLLRPEMVAAFKEEWRAYMDDQVLPEVYGTEIEALSPADMGAPAIPFNPKAVGAACCTFEEALTQAKQGGVV